MELKDLQNEVLRKIGRNVLNFQKMEAMLKMSIAHNHVSGPVHDLAGIVKRKEKSVSKKSMGNLMSDHVHSLYLERPIEEESIPEDVVWLSYSVKLGSDEDSVRKRKSTLARIVKERNKLIHKLPESYDPSSIQGCEEMISALDEQHALLVPEYRAMQAICEAIHQARKDAVGFLLGELQGGLK